MVAAAFSLGLLVAIAYLPVAIVSGPDKLAANRFVVPLLVVQGDARGERAERFLRSAERFCVVLDTLRTGVPVESTFDLQEATRPSS